MTIIWEGADKFSIKTKNLTCKIGSQNKLGELEIPGPGEYEVSGVQMEIIDGIIQVFSEGMTIGHIKKGKVLTDDELEKLNNINILLIGVGGKEYTETKTALEVISQIDPAVVVPMGADLEEFIKEENASNKEIEEFKVAKADLLADSLDIVVLKAK